MRAWGRKTCESIKCTPYYGLLEAMGKEVNWWFNFPLECDKPCWAKLLFWRGILASQAHSWGLLCFPPCPRISYKRGSMLRMRMSYTTRSKSKNGRPFWAAKEVHHVTFEAFVEVCYQLRSLVVDLSTFIGSLPYLFIGPFHGFIPFSISNLHPPRRQ
jgi:hypothetical protein